MELSSIAQHSGILTPDGIIGVHILLLPSTFTMWACQHLINLITSRPFSRRKPLIGLSLLRPLTVFHIIRSVYIVRCLFKIHPHRSADCRRPLLDTPLSKQS
jgi:hypothetical protein